MRIVPALLAATILVLPTPCLAWGYEGHEIVAEIARAYLTPDVRARVDAMLAADPDTLTGHDMASAATWADVYRNGHRETSQWHFVDQEIDGSADLRAACFGYPAAGRPASSGPAQDCVVDKINEFAAELAAPDTATTERLLALKFVLHFVGDVHQPLHAADNHDRGGNCVSVLLGPSRVVNLHAIWDTVLVNDLGSDPEKVAAELRSHTTPAQVRAWQRGTAADWANESFAVAKTVAYSVKTPSGCSSNPTPIELTRGYEATATSVAALQLSRAGVRLAGLLNQALGEPAATGTSGGKGG